MHQVKSFFSFYKINTFIRRYVLNLNKKLNKVPSSTLSFNTLFLIVIFIFVISVIIFIFVDFFNTSDKYSTNSNESSTTSSLINFVDLYNQHIQQVKHAPMVYEFTFILPVSIIEQLKAKFSGWTTFASYSYSRISSESENNYTSFRMPLDEKLIEVIKYIESLSGNTITGSSKYQQYFGIIVNDYTFNVNRILNKYSSYVTVHSSPEGSLYPVITNYMYMKYLKIKLNEHFFKILEYIELSKFTVTDEAISVLRKEREEFARVKKVEWDEASRLQNEACLEWYKQIEVQHEQFLEWSKQNSKHIK